MTASKPLHTPIRVREVDPAELLLMPSLSGVLQPYLPRDVDKEFDRLLSSPGLVLVQAESFAGARRSAYEALLRNMPDALFISYYDWNLDDADAEVLWVDYHDRASGDLSLEYPRLNSWLAQSRERSAIVLTDVTGVGLLDPAQRRSLLPRMIHVRSTLTENERSMSGVGDSETAPRSVNEIFTASVIPPLTGTRTRNLSSDPSAEGVVSHRAGYHPDTDTGDDQLGIAADVDMLADLIASRHIVPPLSIGLFGSWGSGKSFFMRQMRKRVRDLADATAAAEAAAGVTGSEVSAYCASIRQISFNAWHYAESNLWASLATHLLDTLASSGSEEELERHANDLAEKRSRQRSLLDRLSSVRVERMLVAVQLEQETDGASFTGAVGELARLLTEEDWVTGADGRMQPDTLDEAKAFARESIGLTTEARNFWRRFRRSRTAWIILGLGAAAAVSAFLLATSPLWPALVGGLALVLSLLPVARTMRSSLSRIRGAADRLNEMAKAPARIRLADLEAEQARLEQAVNELTPSRDIAAFARSREQSLDYRQHLSVVSLVRSDLEVFAAMLSEHQSAGRSSGPERIVLYIDDLDRCPPDVVVKVLEAVHLLLAQPVFTIVVAADVDWLLHSLRQHYGSVLDTETGTSGGARHYLEKIFQVPLTLALMTADGFTRLVTELTSDRYPAARARIDFEQPPTAAKGPRPDTAAPETGPGATRAQESAPSVPHLRPSRLEITQTELDYIASLAPLVRSPRSAKRLINLYRLIRARLRDSELSDFLEGPEPDSKAVILLLALMAGPADPATLFHSIELADGLTTWESLRSDLPQFDLPVSIPVSLSALQYWLPLVRRFSFAHE